SVVRLRLFPPAPPLVAGFSPRLTPLINNPKPACDQRPQPSADDFIFREELSDLLGRGFGRVRAMYRVFPDRLGGCLSDGSGRRLCGIRRTHDVAIFGDRALAFEPLHDPRPGCTESNQFAKKRALAMYRIKPFGLGLADVKALLGDDPQPSM